MPKVEELMVGLWVGRGIRDGLGFRAGTSFACDQPRKRWQMRHTGGGAARPFSSTAANRFSIISSATGHPSWTWWWFYHVDALQIDYSCCSFYNSSDATGSADQSGWASLHSGGENFFFSLESYCRNRDSSSPQEKDATQRLRTASSSSYPKLGFSEYKTKTGLLLCTQNWAFFE